MQTRAQSKSLCISVKFCTVKNGRSEAMELCSGWHIFTITYNFFYELINHKNKKKMVELM